MANYADYIKPQTDELDTELEDAKAQQQERGEQQAAPSSDIDWEKRYKDLERLNSQQAQHLGQYRNLVDEYITSTSETPESEEPSQPISVDDFYDNPDETLNKAIESHPVVKQAKSSLEDMKKRELEREITQFMSRHPDMQTITADPKFTDWVREDAYRTELYQRGDKLDLPAADALLTLYKTQQNLDVAQNEHTEREAVAHASLEESSNTVAPQEPPKYSRSEYVNKLMRAKQGDLEADEWVKRNSAGYRAALESGNVRD